MKYLYLSLILLLQGCNEKTTSITDVEKIKINVFDAKNVNFSEVYESMELLKLSNETILGQIKNIRFYDKKIFVVCDNGIFVYDEKGDFISKLDKKGEGPNEYRSLTDAIVTDGKIEILDRKQKKILYYSIDGKYLESWKFDFFADAFHKIDNDLYAFYKGNNLEKDKDYVYVTKSRSSGNTRSEYIEMIPSQVKYMQFTDLTNFSQYKSDISFLYSSSNVIYKIKNEILSPRFIVDFGKNSIESAFLEKKYDDVAYFMNAFWKKDYAFFIDAFFESESKIFFSFDVSKEKRHVFFDKKNRKPIIAKKMVDDFSDGFMSFDVSYLNTPRGVLDEKLYYLIEPSILKEKLENYKKSKKKQDLEKLFEKYPLLRDLLLNSTPIDNPILLLLKMNK